VATGTGDDPVLDEHIAARPGDAVFRYHASRAVVTPLTPACETYP
jgi:hypothetical protein